ncbi:hypothetical protein LPLAFNJD_LOCUS2355 [Methylorubrum aminovorans]
MKLEHIVSEKNAKLNEIASNNPPEFLLGAPQLHDDDCIKIARIIIVFNYIEMNMRRMIEIFLRANKISTKHLKYGSYVDIANLNDKLLEGFNNLDISRKEIEHIEFRLKDIAYCRNFRNMVAHSAARRFPNEPAVVFFSKDDKESIRRTGSPVGFDHLSWMIILDDDLKMLLDRITEHEVWVAKATTKTYTDLILNDQLRESED